MSFFGESWVLIRSSKSIVTESIIPTQLGIGSFDIVLNPIFGDLFYGSLGKAENSTPTEEPSPLLVPETNHNSKSPIRNSDCSNDNVIEIENPREAVDSVSDGLCTKDNGPVTVVEEPNNQIVLVPEQDLVTPAKPTHVRIIQTRSKTRSQERERARAAAPSYFQPLVKAAKYNYVKHISSKALLKDREIIDELDNLDIEVPQKKPFDDPFFTSEGED